MRVCVCVCAHVCSVQRQNSSCVYLICSVGRMCLSVCVRVCVCVCVFVLVVCVVRLCVALSMTSVYQLNKCLLREGGATGARVEGSSAVQ